MNMPKIKANEKYVDNGPCEREDCQLYCKSWDNNCKLNERLQTINTLLPAVERAQLGGRSGGGFSGLVFGVFVCHNWPPLFR